MPERTPQRLIKLIIAVCALFLGTLEYVLSRPTHSSGLGTAILGTASDFPWKVSIFGFLGGVIPEFIHPFSFALITMALYPRVDQKTRGIICVFWLVVEVLFELGQAFGHQISQFLGNTLPHGGIIRLLRNYFARGTYDHLDILAICLGIASAFIIGEILTRKEGKENETRTSKQTKTKDHRALPGRPIMETGG
jgi:hypothetical protein